MPYLLIASLILRSFHNKLVWFKYPNSSTEDIYVIPVAAARVPGSVLPTSYWFYCSCCWAFHCHILHPLVSVALFGWSGHYFLAASYSWYYVLHRYCDPKTSPLKTANLVGFFFKSCFPHLRFLIHIFRVIFVGFLYPSDQLSFVWYNVLLPFSVYSKLCQR